MGYGFSFFRNASDHCNIALGALAVARIEDVLRQRALAPSSKDLLEAGELSATEPAIKTTGDHSVTGIGWVRLLPADHAGARVKPNQRPCIFSESFLQLASIAFFNARETTTGIPIIDANLCSANVTRNKLHTLCAIAMILQKQCEKIIESNSDLPPWPLNPRQFHAARYRRGQLLILRTVSSSIVADLRRLAGFDGTCPRDKRIMRLEHILKTGPKEFLQDFRAALHIGLGTRDAAKIREQNLVESAFTLWLCGLWLWTLPKWSLESKSLDRPPLLARTASWIAFVGATYGDDSAIGKQWARLPASQEGQLLAESYHYIVQAAAAKNPQSVYNRSEATTGQLLWCLRVIREESFVCPSLGGEFGDDVLEIVLFLEDRAPFADTI
ncbi:MAG: hypothetical protein LQ338_006887 [Usnochroma carphineum]|nr:MAG: hypothetical protein LQ338_006887 [Usnochroma carphineum]